MNFERKQSLNNVDFFFSEEEDWPQNCISLGGATEKKVYALLSQIITFHFDFSLP